MNLRVVKKNVSIKKLCDNDFCNFYVCNKSIKKFHKNSVQYFLFYISNLAKPSENLWKLVKSLSLKCLQQTLPSSVYPNRFLVLFIKLFHFLKVEHHLGILMMKLLRQLDLTSSHRPHTYSSFGLGHIGSQEVGRLW